MDKSPENQEAMDLIRGRFEARAPSTIIYSDPLAKAEFLVHLINFTDDTVIFVDLDYMYAGYLKSEMIKERDNVILLHPQKDSWNADMVKVISRVSKERCLVVIDSLNGVYSMFDDLRLTRFINSSLILLASVASQVKSTILITAMAKKKDRWVLSPSGRQLVRSAHSGLFYLKKEQKRLVLSEIGRDSEITDRKVLLKTAL